MHGYRVTHSSQPSSTGRSVGDVCNTQLKENVICVNFCLQILVQQGAPLSVENEDNWTPCESAEKSNHDKIARFLESKIVFSVSMVVSFFSFCLHVI